MLATFYAKALDADLEKPILGDRWAKDIVDRIDYDWKKTTITARTSPAVTTRSAHFDELGAAVSGRAPRSRGAAPGLWSGQPVLPVGPRPGRRVVRRRLPRCRRRCASSFTRSGSTTTSSPPRSPIRPGSTDIPADRPTLMIGEGLTMYLTEEDGIALLRRIVEHAPSGELQFDAFNRLGIKSQWTNSGGAAFRGDAALGHRRARRHRQGGARSAAAGMGIGHRIGRLRPGALVLPGDGST